MSLYDFNGNVVGESVKAERPADGVEHFKVKINKGDYSVNSNTEGLQDIPEEYEDDAVIFIPKTYSRSGTPTRLIISCHGSGTVVNEGFLQTSKTWNDFLVKMGYAVMDVNGGVEGGRHFGAPWAVQSYIKAYQMVVEKYNLYPEVFVLGSSMGGLPAFTLSQCGCIPVKALAGFCPVVDMYYQAWCFPWYSGETEDYSVQRQKISEYFHFSGSTPSWTKLQAPSEEEKQYFLDNIDRVSGFNPILCKTANYKESGAYTMQEENPENFAKLVKIQNVPVKIWQADTDPTVPAKYGKYLIQSIKNSGGIAEHRGYTSGGHTPGWGEKISAINEKGESVEGYTNEVECYYWFKRWE